MSMSNEELQALLIATFADEAKEQLQTINEKLLELEKAGDDDRGPLLEEIFREAHSLKGASRAVNLDRVEKVAHRLESLFSKIQNGEVEPDPSIYDVCYAALDGIGALVAEGVTGEAADVDEDALVAQLEALAEGGAAPAAPKAEKAQAEPAAEAEPAAAAPEPKPEPVAEEPTKKPAPKKAKAPKKEPVQAEETVRVATSKLDALMAQVGELLAARIGAEHRLGEVRALFDESMAVEDAWRKVRPKLRQLSAALESGEADMSLFEEVRALVPVLETSDERLRGVRGGLGELRRKFEADARRMAQVTTDLQDDVRRTRMLPVSTVFDTFPRMVRDITRELSKEVALNIEGGETEVDRSVLEQLRSPLTHMIRNCVDHAIEMPDDRAAAGKSREGTVVLRAYQRGGDLIIEVVDDGKGIDAETMRAKAVEKGLIPADAAEALTEREALWLIFRSGFSTKAEVTDLSGRGVGMDVVREQLERLHGMIDVESTVGEGTKFTLSVPLSVATTRCLLVHAGGETLGIPITNVERIVRLGAEDIGYTEGHEAIRIDDRPMALTRLASVLGLPESDETEGSSSQPAIILGSAERRAAFLVDGLLGAQEVATKTLPKPLVRVRHIGGATIVGTGEIVAILNVLDLLKASGRTAPPPVARKAAPKKTAAKKAAPAKAAPAEETKQSILVVDDSVTIRTFEKAMLEAAGYDVTAASDGLEAWNMLKAGECDLVVSDVEMPNMTGFELTEKIRGDHKLKNMPLVLVTTLSSDADRQRGIDAGADAYVIKGSAEQDKLLETVKRLI